MVCELPSCRLLARRLLPSAVLAILAGLASSVTPAPAAEHDQGNPANTRPGISIVTSLDTADFAEAAAEAHGVNSTFARPTVTTGSTLSAFSEFCAGIGAKYADVVVAPRRMARKELERCHANGVIDIIELPIGHDALVPVVRKGSPVFPVTFRNIYRALAAEHPKDDDFFPNPVKRWSDIHPTLPHLEIRIIGPEAGSAIREFFNEAFMEGGCRGIKEFKEFYDAQDRFRKCTTVIEDGRYISVGRPIADTVIEPLRAGPVGTVAFVPFTVYRRNMHWMDVLPVDGVLPSVESINLEEYEALFPVLFYIKRAQMEQKYGGKGVVAGLYELIELVASEKAAGPDGFFEAEGLVVDDPVNRERHREQALKLVPFSR